MHRSYLYRVCFSISMMMNQCTFLCVVLLSLTFALRADGRACSLVQVYEDRPSDKVRTYRGTAIAKYDEDTDGDFRNSPAKSLWCRDACQDNTRCVYFMYSDTHGKPVTCTLFSKATLNTEKCGGSKCANEIGKCVAGNRIPIWYSCGK